MTKENLQELAKKLSQSFQYSGLEKILFDAAQKVLYEFILAKSNETKKYTECYCEFLNQSPGGFRDAAYDVNKRKHLCNYCESKKNNNECYCYMPPNRIGIKETPKKDLCHYCESKKNEEQEKFDCSPQRGIRF